MSEATRTRTHAPEVRQRAVEVLQEGVGHRALAAELGIPQATARQWARAYAVGGADAVLNAGSHHHTYSYEVKLAVVKDRLENGLTVREAMIKHKIPSESSVKAWCRQYRESGESALVDKPRTVARAPVAAIGGVSPLCSKADVPLPRTPKTPQLTENPPPLLLN